MTELVYAVLYAPVTDAPIYPTDPIVVSGRRMSAGIALTRYTRAELESQGFRFPTPSDISGEGQGHVVARAKSLQEAAAGDYAWPESAAWLALEEQSRAYLADPGAGAGPDLAADCGDCSDPAAVAARASSIVAKADAFRTLRGEIVRWRREAIAQVQIAQAGGADVDGMRAAVAAAIASAPVVPA